MTSDQVVALLKHYNAWRRDDEGVVKMPEPRDIGEAIDAAIHLLSSRKSAKNLTFRWNHTTKPSLFEVWENGVLIHSGPYNQAPAIKP